MDARGTGRGHGGRVVAAIVTVLVVAVLACVAVVGFAAKASVDRMTTQANAAIDAATRLQQGIGDELAALGVNVAVSTRGDSAGGAVDVAAEASALDDATTAIASELEGWPWNLIGSLPYVGSDVTFARSLVADAREVTATLPAAATHFQQVASGGALLGGGELSADAVADDIQHVRELIGALQATRDASAAAAAEMRALPDAHVAQLNEGRDQLAAALDSLNATFDEYAEQLDAVAGLGLNEDGTRSTDSGGDTAADALADAYDAARSLVSTIASAVSS